METSTINILVTDPDVDRLSEYYKKKYMQYNGYILVGCGRRGEDAVMFVDATWSYYFEKDDFINLDLWFADVNSPTQEEIVALRMVYPVLRMNEDNTSPLQLVSL